MRAWKDADRLCGAEKPAGRDSGGAVPAREGERPQDIDDPDARKQSGKAVHPPPFAFRNKEILRETAILYTGCKGSTIKNQTNTKK